MTKTTAATAMAGGNRQQSAIISNRRINGGGGNGKGDSNGNGNRFRDSNRNGNSDSNIYDADANNGGGSSNGNDDNGTAMVGGTDNNQLKATAEEMWAAVATVTARDSNGDSNKMTPMTVHQQQ